jgi:RNA-directed DNA polymerase
MRNIIKINWNEVDWKKIESRVFRIQRRIYKAKTDKKVTAVHYLQKKIIIGFQEKLMSIREASKINKFYWIKTIYINTSKKTIKIAYTSNLKKILILDSKTIKNLKKLLLTSEPTINQLIKNEAKQYLVKLALEPEWASNFEIYSMGHNLGQSYQDTLEHIFSKLTLSKEYSFQRNLFEGFKNFNTARFIKKLNTIKIIKVQIEQWLEFNILSFAERKLPFYTNLGLETGEKNFILPLLYDIAFSGLETYLTQFINDKIKNWSGEKKIKYFRYLNHILILSEDLNTLNQIVLICSCYLKNLGSYTHTKTSRILQITSGIDFLGFHIIILKRKNQFQKKISISKESKKFILAKTRFIIQKNNRYDFKNI